ncbi:flagellar basal body-associated FliL family protein [Actinoplanes sp. NPDC089786]|uniref:flagellar basal body-associated FliL family protein n=1 Tax=Actinoplanes sp. NPDC089786 TaxID=3155185 RepID=UPI00344230BD
MAEQKTEAAEAPKKSKKMLMIIVIALVVLGGGGAGAFFMLKGDKAEAKPEAPVKGAVVTMENAITINLADAHYLKLAFTLQLTEAAGEEAPDIAEAIDLAIDQYTGMKVGELETEKGRDTAKAELLEKVEKAYLKEGETESPVMDIYFTQFVTQ